MVHIQNTTSALKERQDQWSMQNHIERFWKNCELKFGVRRFTAVELKVKSESHRNQD